MTREELAEASTHLMYWLISEYGAELGKLACSSTEEGTTYLSVVSGGFKEEGECFPAYYSTVDLAIDAWKDQIVVIEGRKLLVRSWPEVIENKGLISWEDGLYHELTLYTVYSRMVSE